MARVYIGRLPWGIGERDIAKFFDGYGRIVNIFMKNGYAFVEFSSKRDAEDAVKHLDNKRLWGERYVKSLRRVSSEFLWKWPRESRGLNEEGMVHALDHVTVDGVEVVIGKGVDLVQETARGNVAVRALVVNRRNVDPRDEADLEVETEARRADLRLLARVC